MRHAILLAPALALAACSSGHLGDRPLDASSGDHPSDPTVSPGTVTLRLLLPSSRSFCDHLQCAFIAPHISITNTTGQPVVLSPGFCPTTCAVECRQQLCPLLCVFAPDVAVTNVEVTWDGLYYASSTCGAGTSCYNKSFVAAGNYVARLCATPGTLAEVDAGSPESPPSPQCTASGPEECVEVPFMIPSASVFEASLPDTIN